MIFAAGFGTRMKDLTKMQPKPMIPVAGRPLIDHTLDLVRAVNPQRIVVNLHYRPEPLLQHLQGCKVQTIVEQPDILDTGGGLRNALPLLGEGPVFTTNSDAIWSGGNPLQMIADAWRPDDMDALLMCVPTPNAIGHTGTGDFKMDADGRLSRGPGVVYGGVQIIKTSLLETFPEKVFSLNILWDKMHAARRLFGICYPGRWCDVGHPDGIALAEGLLETRDV